MTPVPTGSAEENGSAIGPPDARDPVIYKHRENAEALAGYFAK